MGTITELNDAELDQINGGVWGWVKVVAKAVRDGVIYETVVYVWKELGDGSAGGGVGTQDGCHNQCPW